MEIHYQYMMPPFFKPYHEMTANEAKQYFEYYISQIPNRINYLQNFLESNANKLIELDFTKKSLVEFWDWYENLLVEQKETNYTEGTPLNLSYDVLGISSDFAMYFGETFVRNHSSIYWGYKKKPKSNFYLNWPSLLGFQKNLVHCPENSISILVSRSLEKKDKNATLKLYSTWEEWI